MISFSDLGPADFPAAFTFSRPVPGDFRDSDGNLQTAQEDVPRFDHDIEGGPLGLLVEGGAELGEADRVRIKPEQLPEYLLGRDTTVFHERQLEGVVERRAWYSRNPGATINAIMNTQGHHLAIGVVESFRENKGGFVRYRGLSWLLIGLIDAGDGAVLANQAGQPIIGS